MPLITKRYSSVLDCLVQLKKLGKLDDAASEGRFRNGAAAHMTAEYEGRVGIVSALHARYGASVRDMRCVPYLELNVDTDTETGSVEFMIAVDTPDGWEAFDREEALGYSVFIKDIEGQRARLEALKQKQLDNKRAEL